MITGGRKHTRKPEIPRILRARQQSRFSLTKQARMQFRLPIFNFACKYYTEMIDWSIEK